MEFRNNSKRLASNFISLSTVKGLQFIIPILVLPYLLKTIGVEKFGEVSFSLSIATYFGAVVQYGFSVTATREISRSRGDAQQISVLYSKSLAASFILALISIVSYLVWLALSDMEQDTKFLYAFSMTFILTQSLIPLWLFQGLECMKYIAIVNLTSSALYLTLIVIFVESEKDFVLVPFLNLIAALVALSLCMILVRYKLRVKFILPSMYEIVVTYKLGWSAFLNQFFPNLYNNTSLFMLGLIESNAVVGLYAAVVRVVDAICSVGYILSSTFLPYIALDIKRHRVFRTIMLLLSIALLLLLILSGDFISSVLVGEEDDISTYLRFLALSIPLLFVVITYGTNYLMLVGRDIVMGRISVVVSFVSLGLALLLIPLMGIWGALLTIFSARLVLAISTYAYYRISTRKWI